MGADSSLARRPLLIAVDGFSGAGKTTLAADLAAALAGRASVQLFHLEDIYPGWDGLEPGMTYYRERILRPLAAGQAARWQPWDWEAGRYGSARTTEPAGVVVVEGVGAAHRQARDLLDAVVWVDGPQELRRRHALERDGDTYAPHWERWAAQERRWAADDDAASAADVRVQLLGRSGTAEALAAVLAVLPAVPAAATAASR